MEQTTELILPKDCPQDLYDRIKNYVGKEWHESNNDVSEQSAIGEEKHFFYIDNTRNNSPSILVFEKWTYKIKPPTYSDLELPSPKLKISTSALKNLF